MKRLFLGTALVAALALAIPAAASAATKYDAFVGCNEGASDPVPSHVCTLADLPAAYFEADVETEYDVCLEFPDETIECAEGLPAEAEALYRDSLPTLTAPGDYEAFWEVEGVEVASWAFRMDPRPTPPAPPVLPPPLPAPPVLPTVAVPSPACLKGKKQVTQFKSKLQNTTGRKAKAKVRGKLKAAKATVKRAC